MFTHPFQIDNFDDETTFTESETIFRKIIANYIDRFRKIDVKQSIDGQKLLFYVDHYSKDERTKSDFILVLLEELKH